MTRPAPLARAAFAHFTPITTRWHDNDVFGHVNNVVYYAFFDTAVNRPLVEKGLLDPLTSAVAGLVVETRCTYFQSLKFPDPVEAGLAVEHLGTSSVRYRIGIFRAGEERAAAQGLFTHVYVERASQRPVPIPADVRAHLEGLRR